jgi:hypothetical protein
MKLSAGVVLGTVALVVSCGTGAFVAYDRFDRGFLPASSRTLSAAELEGDAKVRLPAGTTLLSAVWTTTNGGLDTFVYARFRFARADLPRFLTDSGLPQPTPDLRAVADKDYTGGTTWHPDAVTEISGIREDRRRLLFDLGNPADVTVFLEWNEG